MDSANSVQSNTSGSPEAQHIRLACQACQRKKIKCDRNFPCGQCTRSSLHCVPSTRKPRARHTGKRAVDSELRSRISKLESLVESLSGEVGASTEDDEDTPSTEATPTEPDASSPAVGKYVASPFWSSLSNEVQALKEALEDQADDEPEPHPTSTNGHPNSIDYDFLILPPGSVYVMPGALNEPNHELSAYLCDVFCDNCDRLYRTVHVPSFKAFMINGKPYFGHDASAVCNLALKATVWYAATNTLTEDECHMAFGRPKAAQLAQFRRTADISLAQADLMNTMDMATLQAFSIYLVTTRAADPSRRVWTLTATAIRIARGMGLHHESIARSPFETEMRRRLWHNMRFLDVSCSLDRGSELLINTNSYDTPIPKNTNDSEFDEHSTVIPEHESGLTDMSFALLTYDATAHTHRLTIPESRPNGDTLKLREEFAQKFADTIQEKYIKYCDLSDPFQKMLAGVAKSMTSSMRLRAVRPMQKYVSSALPRVDSEYVLGLAAEALRNGDRTVNAGPEMQKWRCLVWVQWHALAIAIAGLCTNRDTPLANETWGLVDRAYARNAANVADARNGMLWKPIEKLYKKASAFRDHGVTPPSVSPPQAPDMSQLDIAYPVQANIDTTVAQPNLQSSVPGAMPTSGVLNSAMDVNYGDAFMNGVDLANTDLSWMDFERIWEDISIPNPTDINVDGVNMGDMHWPQNVPQNQNCLFPMPQDMM